MYVEMCVRFPFPHVWNSPDFQHSPPPLLSRFTNNKLQNIYDCYLFFFRLLLCAAVLQRNRFPFTVFLLFFFSISSLSLYFVSCFRLYPFIVFRSLIFLFSILKRYCRRCRCFSSFLLFGFCKIHIFC